MAEDKNPNQIREHENKNKFTFLLRQYSEALSYLRHLDSLVWQIPALSMAINSLLLDQYLKAEYYEHRLFILFAALLFTFVFSVALRKHRFSSYARHDDFKWYEKKLIEYFPNEEMRKIAIKTEDVYKDEINYPPPITRNWWTRRKAYTWLWFSMMANMITICLAILYEFGLLSLLANSLLVCSSK